MSFIAVEKWLIFYLRCCFKWTDLLLIEILNKWKLNGINWGRKTERQKDRKTERQKKIIGEKIFILSI